MEVLCVFGSPSDKPVYGPLCELLGITPVVCSAHRDAERLDRIVGESHADIIVAGAGLAAHLPGVIASKTIKPIIGIPVASNFDGLDSLLSIMQMPPGIPVLCAGVGRWQSVTDFVKQKIPRDGIRFDIKGKDCAKAIEKATAMKERLKLPTGNFSITFTDFAHPVIGKGITVLCGEPSAKDAEKLIAITKEGLFVGLNRGENAVLMAAALMGGYDEAIMRYREEMRSI